MAKLDPDKRANLPDRAFAYIDSRGRRRLPINDEAHVRNALARFSQVRFESEAARERARKRLLNAAKKYGIVPVGFITGQLKSERIEGQRQAIAIDVASLPTGFVSFLMTDIEGSTSLLHQLGDRYGKLLTDVRRILRGAVSRANGRVIDERADEFFAVFEQAVDAVATAAAIQRSVTRRTWPGEVAVRLRVGVHSGTPTLTDTGYIGLPVHTAARICSAAHGGQIVVSGETRAVLQEIPVGIDFQSLGSHRLHGLQDEQVLFQLQADGLPVAFPPPRTNVLAQPIYTQAE